MIKFNDRMLAEFKIKDNINSEGIVQRIEIII